MTPLRGINETAELIGVSPWTIRHFIKTGKLRRVKVGRRVLIESNEIERFIEQCRKASQPEPKK